MTLDEWLNAGKPINKVINCDCIEGMKYIEDNSIDLVLTDPPYGILNGLSSFGSGRGKSKAKPTQFKIQWDSIPRKECFVEIVRVSENQIIFGFNYFSDILPRPKGVLCWDKKKPKGTDYSEFELIWLSFRQRSMFIRYRWHGMLQHDMRNKEKRFHPTQKPVAVIRWLLEKFSKENNLILDPFMGSGTTAVAAKQLNRNFLGFEISEEYCKIIEKRLNALPERLDKFVMGKE